MKKQLGLLLNIIALFLFIPGISLPIFSLAMEVTANAGVSSLSSEIINKELSILNTITELWQDDRIIVAILILLFSVCIPILKTSLITIAFYLKNTVQAKKLINFVNVIGKWSMADVFVIAIFLAVMSTNHAETASQHKLNMFGFKLDILMSSETLSNIGMGFYYFTAYCILSMIGTQLSQSAFNNKVEEGQNSILEVSSS